MKIMIFNSLYYPYRIGGAEVSVQLLAEELVKQGHKVRVITLHEHKERKVKMINEVEVVYLPLKNIYWPFNYKVTSRIKKIIWHIIDCYNFVMRENATKEINDFSPDVVHTNNLSGFSVSIWDAVKKTKVKLVHTSRDYYLFHPNSTLFKNGTIMSTKDTSVIFWSFIKKIKSRKVDHYIGISNFILSLHQASGFFTEVDSVVIYNSVSRIKSRKNTEGIIRVGFIGRLSIEKGFDEFCRLSRKYKDNSKYSFIAAGSFSNSGDNDSLKNMANNSNVSIPGYMPLNDFLDNVDVVILPIKWNEPFGRTVVECALSGKLVLTTPVGSMPELGKIFGNVIVTTSIEKNFPEIMLKYEGISTDNSGVKIFEPAEIANAYLKVYN
ncbi:glycosyltransferase family 4 protein [Raoultella scottii]|uniref:glycosyltransferase family 4 protein n=1 Tax=Raoultella scottii TaxID=3040937 RepID=UPI002FA8987A